MNNFMVSINVVLPTFLIIFVGYFLRRINLFDDRTLNVMNNVTFRSFLPILLFYNVYSIKLKGGIDWQLMVFASGSVILSCIILCFIIPRIEKDNRRIGVLIQAIFRSNFVLFGLPITISLFGEKYAGVPSLLIAVIVPTYNFLAVVVLEVFSGGKVKIKGVIKGIITNPLILSALLGLLLMVLNIKLPVVIDSTLQQLAKVATPLALVILGGSFTFKSIGNSFRQLILGVIGKLIILPGIFIPISILLGFRDIELATLIVMFAAPTAISSYTMAEQMGGDGDLAAQQVVFSSAFAVITIFAYIYITKLMGFI